jgi:hypothetical protein
MTGEHLEDHAIGVELQLTELVAQRERAVAQSDEARTAVLDEEIAALQRELVETSDQIADPTHVPTELHAPEADEHLDDL